ncbi:MAG: homocysteine S-methyltransferase family protein, partial [Candidatus Neomarinimicrobiota bacterium]|nr:homocysteine S-methyltransferase family protein [Candidatus Neomarinimicrobiota bacterium]
DLLYGIHQEYVNAGVDYLTTNTFRTTPRAYQKTGLSYKEAHRTAKTSMHNAVQMARKASNDSIKILGSIAPLEDCYSPDLFPGADLATKEFAVITEWLADERIDIFLLETMNNILETETCLNVVEKYKLPIWVSFNLLDSDHIQSGESLKDAIKMVDKFSVNCILLNCNPLNRTFGALETLAQHCSGKWGIYPNLGIGEPSPDGIIKDYHSDAEFIDLTKNAVKLGATVVGGCCGSSPKHIELLKNLIL